jgi:hypothetical protein
MSFNLSLIEEYLSVDNLRSFLLYKPELAQFSSQEFRENDLIMLPLSRSINSRRSAKYFNDSNYLPFLSNASNNYGLLRGLASTIQELPSYASQAISMGGNFFVMSEVQIVYELQRASATLGDLPFAMRSWIDI